MLYRNSIVAALGIIACFAGLLEAKMTQHKGIREPMYKPLTIINTSGKNLYISWKHDNTETKPFIVYLAAGKDIRIKEWNIDKDTIIFVTEVEKMILKYDDILELIRFQLPYGKTVNVKITKDLLLAPNAMFGGLKEKDIQVKCTRKTVDGNTVISNVPVSEFGKKKCKFSVIPFRNTEKTTAFVPQEVNYKEKLAEFLNNQR